jgi:heterotetrameric sarcosine oxidase gamma subunit
MPERDPLHIEPIESRAIVQFKSWLPARGSPPAHRLTVPAECRLLSVAPGEWLLTSDTLAMGQMRDWAYKYREFGIASAGPSHGLAVLVLQGLGAQDVLSQGCGLDFHASRFTPGTCTRTRLAQLPVIIDYVDATPRFELYVGRSYRSYLQSWLHDAAGQTITL